MSATGYATFDTPPAKTNGIRAAPDAGAGIYFEGWDPTRVPGAAPALRDGTWAAMGSMPGARMIS